MKRFALLLLLTCATTIFGQRVQEKEKEIKNTQLVIKSSGKIKAIELIERNGDTTKLRADSRMVSLGVKHLLKGRTIVTVSDSGRVHKFSIEFRENKILKKDFDKRYFLISLHQN